MKISYNWLKQYCNITLDVESLSVVLTDIGLEVEGYEIHQTVKGGLEGIVVGKVLTCEKHPNADKLSKTTVDLGNNTIVPIVCGAPNVAAGQTVLVAKEGAKIYSENDSFEIKQTKIRGEVSQGMICAEDELGLGTSHDGIMVLPDSISAGTLAKEYFNIETDYIFEIGLTPNRIDAASHIGVARDIAAFVSVNAECKITKPSVQEFKISSQESPISITVENSELCPRYAGLVISGVTVDESPKWLQNRLASIGQKSINNVVDITNFVLHEMAQPLHAFDVAKIEGNTVQIKTVADKTKFTTLDGIERELSDADLMICNANKPMCIAGVFGGIESGVTNSTTDVFLESAYFNPVSIRKTARRHGIFTDASFRFERGIDPNNTVYALQRAALLIQEIAGGTIQGPLFDSHPQEFEPCQVRLDIVKICALIGKQIEESIIVRILEALEIKIVSKKDTILEVLVPAYRVDVQRQEDIVEEILRIYGYNNIEIPTAIRSSVVYAADINEPMLKNTVADMLVASGFCEIMNNSLSRSSYYEALSPESAPSLVKILNPLSSELDVMRSSLLFGCLETVSFNQNRQTTDVAVFEFGNVYQIDGQDSKSLKTYKEAHNLALCITGKQLPQIWSEQSKDVTIFILKSHVQKIFAKLGFSNVTFVQSNTDLFIGLQAVIGNKVVANCGMVLPQVLKQFGIDKECFYADILWSQLISISRKDIKYKEIPQFPEVRRDLSLLLDKSVQFSDIEKIAFKTERAILKSVSVFDVYEGKGVPEGKKSYAVSFILQDNEKTLQDKHIDSVMQRLIAQFSKELSAELR